MPTATASRRGLMAERLAVCRGEAKKGRKGTWVRRGINGSKQVTATGLPPFLASASGSQKSHLWRWNNWKLRVPTGQPSRSEAGGSAGTASPKQTRLRRAPARPLWKAKGHQEVTPPPPHFGTCSSCHELLSRSWWFSQIFGSRKRNGKLPHMIGLWVWGTQINKINKRTGTTRNMFPCRDEQSVVPYPSLHFVQPVRNAP